MWGGRRRGRAEGAREFEKRERNTQRVGIAATVSRAQPLVTRRIASSDKLGPACLAHTHDGLELALGVHRSHSVAARCPAAGERGREGEWPWIPARSNPKRSRPASPSLFGVSWLGGRRDAAGGWCGRAGRGWLGATVATGVRGRECLWFLGWVSAQSHGAIGRRRCMTSSGPSPAVFCQTGRRPASTRTQRTAMPGRRASWTARCRSPCRNKQARDPGDRPRKKKGSRTEWDGWDGNGKEGMGKGRGSGKRKRKAKRKRNPRIKPSGGES